MCDRRGSLPVLPEAKWEIFFENLFEASGLCAKRERCCLGLESVGNS